MSGSSHSPERPSRARRLRCQVALSSCNLLERSSPTGRYRTLGPTPPSRRCRCRNAFLSSDEYDEQAHQLYNEGRYDEALDYPQRRALALSPRRRTEHRQGVRPSRAGGIRLGPAQLRAVAQPRTRSRGRPGGSGRDPAQAGRARGGALATFERVLALGFQDDHDLMLQVGRSLFREGAPGHAQRFFELAVNAQPESPEAAACAGYAAHRLGHDARRALWLRRALELEPRPRRGADLPRQHPVRPGRVGSRALPLRADRPGRSLRRAGAVAVRRTEEVPLPSAG